MILKLVEYKLPLEAAGRKSESVNQLFFLKTKQNKECRGGGTTWGGWVT